MKNRCSSLFLSALSLLSRLAEISKSSGFIRIAVDAISLSVLSFTCCVIAIKRGTVPMGLRTTKRAMVDLSKSPNKSEVVISL